MAHSTIDEEQFLEKTSGLFLEYGFAGTSLSQIAAATGLEKASLYYRYPGGKDEIALAVVKRIGTWLEKFVIQPLTAEGNPASQVKEVVRHLRDLYGNGTRWCGLEMLSVKGVNEEIAAALKSALRSWAGAFATLARRSGLPPPEARQRAEQALAQIEGALVLARVLDDPKVFQRAVAELPRILTLS